MSVGVRLLLGTLALPLLAHALGAQGAAAPVYDIWVASGGYNEVALIQFDGEHAEIAHRTPITLDSDSAGLRGLQLAPSGRVYYLITTRGFPTGELVKVDIAMHVARLAVQPSDTVMGTEPLGVQPSAIAISADGRTGWVTNAGASTPSGRGSVSIVYLDRMAEIARLPTCGDANGSVLSPEGDRHYSVCGRDDAVVEFDAQAMTPTRWFGVASGEERGDTSSHFPPPSADSARCDPDWIAPSPDAGRLYVTCRRSGDVVELDRSTWTMVRRLPVGVGPTQCIPTRDGRRLVVVNAGEQTVAIVDLASGQVTARVLMPRRMPSMAVVPATASDPVMALLFGEMALPRTPMAVAVSADSRYAFVAVSGVPGETGTLEIIDLNSGRLVESLGVASGARAVAFWKMEPGVVPPHTP